MNSVEAAQKSSTKNTLGIDILRSTRWVFQVGGYGFTGVTGEVGCGGVIGVVCGGCG